MFEILSVCKGGGYRYCRTHPRHPRANSNGLYPLHRVLAENKLGRLLEPGEQVHHRDEVKSNDSPDNLEVLTNSEHGKHHAQRAPTQAFSCRCGEAFTLTCRQARTRIKQSRTGEIFCSRSCGAKYASRG